MGDFPHRLAEVRRDRGVLDLLDEIIERARNISHGHDDAENEFYLHVLSRGVIVPPLHLFFISEAHSPEDVDQVIAAFTDSLLDVRADGLL